MILLRAYLQYTDEHFAYFFALIKIHIIIPDYEFFLLLVFSDRHGDFATQAELNVLRNELVSYTNALNFHLI